MSVAQAGFSLRLAGTVPGGTATDRLHALVSENSRAVWRFLCRLGLSEADADDALQEVMLVAARRLEDIRPGKERAFLLSSAYRVAAAARRVRTRRQEVSAELLLEMADPNPHPDSVLEQRRALRLLDEVLGQMSIERRAVFVAAEFEGLSLTEIAEVMGVPRGTAASRLRLAKEEFRARVERLEAHHNPARSGS